MSDQSANETFHAAAQTVENFGNALREVQRRKDYEGKALGHLLADYEEVTKERIRRKRRRSQ